MKNLKGSIILFLAAFFWGTTFVAQTSASRCIGAFTYNASRCVVGSLFLFLVAIVKDKMTLVRRKRIAGKTENKAVADSTEALLDGELKDGSQNVKNWPIVPGIICGIILFFAMNSQQFGIGLYPADAAASGRSGFLTATYVIMVAAFVQIRGLKTGNKLDWMIIIAIIGTIAGMYLLCMSGGIDGIYLGDLFGLLCAICFATHIMVVDKYKDVDSVKLSCMQFVICGIISLVVCVIWERPAFADIWSAIIPILYAGILSSGIAYTLQMVGQKYAEPAVASIVMSLESVIAVISGAVVLKEIMSPREITGCVLVFAAVILAQLPEFKNSSKEIVEKNR